MQPMIFNSYSVYQLVLTVDLLISLTCSQRGSNRRERKTRGSQLNRLSGSRISESKVKFLCAPISKSSQGLAQNQTLALFVFYLVKRWL